MITWGVTLLLYGWELLLWCWWIALSLCTRVWRWSLTVWWISSWCSYWLVPPSVRYWLITSLHLVVGLLHWLEPWLRHWVTSCKINFSMQLIHNMYNNKRLCITDMDSTLRYRCLLHELRYSDICLGTLIKVNT